MKLLATLLAMTALLLHAQPTNTLGTVTALNARAGTITLKTDAGPEVFITPTAAAGFRRVAPGETDITKAAVISFQDIATGDRVLARGDRTDRNVSATLIAVISKSDLSSRQAAERADWTRRGVIGVAVGATTDSLTIRSRTKLITIVLTPNAIIRRYAPDSISFVDAKPSALSEIKIGDQVRARGEKDAEGGTLKAEEIISGTFRTVAGLVMAIDPANNEIRATDLDSKKILTIRIRPDSSLRRLPPQIAQAIAAQLHPAPGRGEQQPQDPQQMLDKSTVITTADLKPGDAIVASCSLGDDRITAVSLLAGVEPILTKPGSKNMSLGNWSLDLGQ